MPHCATRGLPPNQHEKAFTTVHTTQVCFPIPTSINFHGLVPGNRKRVQQVHPPEKPKNTPRNLGHPLIFWGVVVCPPHWELPGGLRVFFARHQTKPLFSQVGAQPLLFYWRTVISHSVQVAILFLGCLKNCVKNFSEPNP